MVVRAYLPHHLNLVLRPGDQIDQLHHQNQDLFQGIFIDVKIFFLQNLIWRLKFYKLIHIKLGTQ